MKKGKVFDVWCVEDPEAYGMTEEDLRATWQHLVDSGLAWSLQGWYGRTAQALLDRGFIKYPKKRTHDYYGNAIPTRDEIKRKRR
jgi:hypothetical protein